MTAINQLFVLVTDTKYPDSDRTKKWNKKVSDGTKKLVMERKKWNRGIKLTESP